MDLKQTVVSVGLASTFALLTGCAANGGMGAGMRLPIGDKDVTIDPRTGQTFIVDRKDRSVESFGPLGTCKAWTDPRTRQRYSTGLPCR